MSKLPKNRRVAPQVIRGVIAISAATFLYGSGRFRLLAAHRRHRQLDPMSLSSRSWNPRSSSSAIAMRRPMQLPLRTESTRPAMSRSAEYNNGLRFAAKTATTRCCSSWYGGPGDATNPWGLRSFSRLAERTSPLCNGTSVEPEERSEETGAASASDHHPRPYGPGRHRAFRNG